MGVVSPLIIRVALLVPLIGLWFILHPERSYACICVPPLSPDYDDSPSGERARSAAVFMGKVVSIRDFEPDEHDFAQSIIEFDVKTVWKGFAYQTMYLATRSGTGSCGYRFREGTEYVVYSHDGRSAWLCDRILGLWYAADDLAELGEGHVPRAGTIAPTPVSYKDGTEGQVATQGTESPTPTSSKNRTGGGCGFSPSTIDISVMGLIVGIAWLGLRKRRSGGR